MYGNEVITRLTASFKFMEMARKRIPDWEDPYPVREKKHGKKPNGLYSLMHDGNDYITKIVIDGIRTAQHFHIDYNLMNVEGFLKREFNVQPFMNEMAVDVNLPFPLCWIDYDHIIESDGHIEKKGVLVESINYNGHTFLRCIYVGTLHRVSKDIDWIAMPMIMYIKVGSELSVDEMVHFTSIENSKYDLNEEIETTTREFKEMFENADENEAVINSFILPICKRNFKDLSDPDKDFYSLSEQCLIYTMMVVNMFLLTLNCKNIKAVDTYPKKRVKLGRKTRYVELKNKFQYKVLEIILPKTTKKSGSNGTGTGEEKRVHFCMGSYATYTEDKPMFGKREGRKPITGRFWRQGSLKGSKEKGVVIKEYNATAPKDKDPDIKK